MLNQYIIKSRTLFILEKENELLKVLKTLNTRDTFPTLQNSIYKEGQSENPLDKGYVSSSDSQKYILLFPFISSMAPIYFW